MSVYIKTFLKNIQKCKGALLCACKWSAKAKTPVFPPEGVSLQHTQRLHWTPLFTSVT